MKQARYSTFLEMIKAQRGDSIALRFLFQGQVKSLTYDCLATTIEDFPAEKHGCVGIFADGTLASLVAILGYVNKGTQIALLSPLTPKDTLIAQIQNADIDYLLGPKDYVEGLKPFLSKRPPISQGKILFFTSGTTSSSKAVVLTQASLCASAYNGSSLLPLTREDVLYSCLPLSHVFGFVCSLLWGFNCGASVALSSGMKTMFSDFSAFKPTVVSLVPQMASFFSARRLFNPELRLALIGAGECRDKVISSIKECGIAVSYGYGLTETSSGVALSLGEDPRLMSVCPDDEISISEDGEILIASPSCMMEGYYRDEKATFIALQGGVFHTGDLGEITPQGFLKLKGRKKDVLVLEDGNKIYCPEYEEKLSHYLPEGSDFGIALNSKGQVALLLGSTKMGDDYSKGVASFNQTCPYSQRIAQVAYFPNPLPRTQTGKIQRYLLPSMLEN